MMSLLLVLVVAGGNLTGFWHSEPDLSEGYGTCYFFWEDGSYGYLPSIEEGAVYIGEWSATEDGMLLVRTDGILLDGSHYVNVMREEREVSMSLPSCKTDRMLLDGAVYWRLERDPDTAILSLMPTWGMSDSERDAFSTYD